MRKVFEFYNTIVTELLSFFQNHVTEEISENDMKQIINVRKYK
jgi:hypothetical protein